MQLSRLSRINRWQQAAIDALRAVDTLRDLQAEYQDWYDNLPENLHRSPLAEKLEAVYDLDLDDALYTMWLWPRLTLPSLPWGCGPGAPVQTSPKHPLHQCGNKSTVSEV